MKLTCNESSVTNTSTGNSIISYVSINKSYKMLVKVRTKKYVLYTTVMLRHFYGSNIERHVLIWMLKKNFRTKFCSLHTTLIDALHVHPSYISIGRGRDEDISLPEVP